jgi:hypothetical protein
VPSTTGRPITTQSPLAPVAHNVHQGAANDDHAAEGDVAKDDGYGYYVPDHGRKKLTHSPLILVSRHASSAPSLWCAAG